MWYPRRMSRILVLLALLSFSIAVPISAEAVEAVILCNGESCDGFSGVEGDTVQFDGRDSTGQGEIDTLSYNWQFGDVATPSTLPNPAHTYVFPHNPGVPSQATGFVVVLTVTSNTAPYPSDQTSVIIPISNATPEAVAYGFDVDGTIQYEQLAVFKDTWTTFHGEDSSDASGEINAYAWDWDWDGSPTHFDADNPNATASNIWNTIGTYMVGLRVTDTDNPAGVGYTSLTVNVIHKGPWARVDRDLETFAEGEEVRFNAVHTVPNPYEIVSFEWDFDYSGSPAEFSPEAFGEVVIHSFEDARLYNAAVRVTDNYSSGEYPNGRTYIAFAQVTPENVLPEANLVVRTTEGDLLEAPYTIEEGQELRFDASGSQAVPGSITGYQWDWDYLESVGFSPTPGDSARIINHSWDEDSDHNPDSAPFVVRLRVIDDDSTDDFTNVSVIVTDIPPQAAISGETELQEGDEGHFSVSDVSNNTDEIIKIEWDFGYDGDPEHFTAQVTGSVLTGDLDDAWLVQPSWNATGQAHIAVRITDDDNLTSLDDHLIDIVDKPPTAIITPHGTSNEYTMDEGEVVTFSAMQSSVAPGDRIVAIHWDLSYDGVAFVNDEEAETVTSTCTGGFCSEATFIECVEDEDCPTGAGQVNVRFGENTVGTDREHVALCIEDTDGNSTCTEGDPSLFVLSIQVQNVAPQFDDSIVISDRIWEWDTFNFTPTIIEPGDNDPLTFTCLQKPEGMECNSFTGSLSWVTTSSDVDCSGTPDPSHRVQLKVEDDDGGSDTLTIDILVMNKNDTPDFVVFPENGVAFPNSEFNTEFGGYDPDNVCGEILTYYLQHEEDGMNIDHVGRFKWTPTESDVGSHSFNVCIRDDELLFTCREYSIEVLNPSDAAEVDAGEDQELLPGYVCAAGSVTSNPNNRQLTYRWVQDNSDDVEVYLNPDWMSEYPNDPIACFYTTAHGEYNLVLDANNTLRWGPTDRTSISILDQPPTAVAELGRSYTPSSIVYLDASRSGDINENDSISYLWTDNAEILDSTTIAEPSFVPLEAGLYSFELTVNDGLNDSEPLAVDVEVLDIENHKALPCAYIREVPLTVTGTEVILDGSVSSDRRKLEDPVSLTYTWEYIEGPMDTPTLDTGTPGYLYFTPTEAGLYTFRLMVSNEVDDSRPYLRQFAIGETSNEPPVAEADLSFGATLATVDGSAPPTTFVKVELNGSYSTDREQAALSYSWRQIGGVAVTLQGSDTERPTFYASESGLYTFELTVNDGQIDSLPDTVTVAVSSEGNSAPIPSILNMDTEAARPGADGVIVTNPNELVTLDAGGSVDLDDDEMHFEWSQLDGPAVVLSSWTAQSVSFTPDILEVTYRFQLVVYDDHGDPSVPMIVDVEALSEYNSAPVCSVDETIIDDVVVGFPIVMDGSDTYDPDQDELTYEWSLISADSVVDEVTTLVDGLTPTATFTPLTYGHYAFWFRSWDQSTNCRVRVDIDVDPNNTPTADAGGDLTVCIGNPVDIDGSNSSDPDGHELVDFQWTVLEDGNTLGLSDADLIPVTESGDKVSFTAFDTGQAQIQLIVSDGFENGDSVADVMTLTVEVCNTDDCVDEDKDNYFVGSTCASGVPIDCDDTDAQRNAGIACSCDPDPDQCCVDQDKDGYGQGNGCTGPDEDDSDPCLPDDSNEEVCGGGGGGCQSTQTTPAVLLLVFALFAATLQRSRRKSLR